MPLSRIFNARFRRLAGAYNFVNKKIHRILLFLYEDVNIARLS